MSVLVRSSETISPPAEVAALTPAPALGNSSDGVPALVAGAVVCGVSGVSTRTGTNDALDVSGTE